MDVLGAVGYGMWTVAGSYSRVEYSTPCARKMIPYATGTFIELRAGNRIREGSGRFRTNKPTGS